MIRAGTHVDVQAHRRATARDAGLVAAWRGIEFPEVPDDASVPGQRRPGLRRRAAELKPDPQGGGWQPAVSSLTAAARHPESAVSTSCHLQAPCDSLQ